MMLKYIFNNLNVKRALIGFLAVFVVSFVVALAYVVKHENELKDAVSAILVSANDDSFLIVGSQTFKINRYIEVEPSSGWREIFWGHKLFIEGTVKVSYGYDLMKAQVSIRRPDYCIEIRLPKPEIYSTEVLGPIKLFSKTGVLYTLIKQDKLKDYNLAVSVLKEGAKSQLSEEKLNELAKQGFNKLLESLRITKRICDVLYNN